MKKSVLSIIAIVVLSVMALFFISGCKDNVQPGINETLYNNSANEALENASNNVPEFVEFMFNYSNRSEAKYELARDDILSLSKGNFTSEEISVFGIMLGDSYDDVLSKVGMPDVTYIAPDKSYKNMEYRGRVGIKGVSAGITYHLENDTVTIINIRNSFNKYLHGNTSMGTDRVLIYDLVGIPDYQDFLDVYRIYHYVEKGLDMYFRDDKSAIYSFYIPQEFKGVEYVTGSKDFGGGISLNVTEAVLKK